MSATINFISAYLNTITELAGSGLGFYGAGGFGASVQVGAYQDNTFITDPTGAVNGPKGNNIKYVHPNSGDLGGGDVRVLQGIPNQLATLQIEFTNDTPVKTQNAVVYIFDRVNINNPASGVTTKVAEIIHPWNTQSPNGSGDTSWWTPGGSGGTIGGVTYDPPVSLVSSPGSGGWSPSGVNTVDTVHTWALAISGSPDSIGSKSQYALYCSLEYL